MFSDTMVKDICSRWGGKGNFKFIKGAQPLINDPVLTSMAKKSIAEIIDKNTHYRSSQQRYWDDSGKVKFIAVL